VSLVRPAFVPGLVLVLALLLTACGGAPASSTDSAAPSTASSAPTKPAAPAAAEVARQGGGAGAPVPAATSVPPGAGKPGAAPAAPGKPEPAPALPLDQRIIRTGKIDLFVADISASLRAITQMVRTAGGYIQQSATRDQNNVTVAELVLRVPVEQYDGVFQELRDLAVPDKKPIESSESQDVTEEFADVQARITNLKATEAQLLKLLARAEKMEDILTVQRELTTVREQIERLQGRLNVLDRRAAFSTIAVTLRPQPEARRPNPPTPQVPAAGAARVGTRPTFSWSVSEGATAYALQVATEVDTAFASPVLTLDKLTVTSVEWPGGIDELRQGSVYRWRVRASNASGDGEWSAPRTFTTVPAWNPLRPVSESWAASLVFLQTAFDAVLRVVVFFWWAIPLVALFIVFVRWLNRLPTRRSSPPPAPPAPPRA
jgi:hypothetical protein